MPPEKTRHEYWKFYSDIQHTATLHTISYFGSASLSNDKIKLRITRFKLIKKNYCVTS
jgi:hypothetical protein